MSIQRELKFKIHNFKLDVSQFNYESIAQYFINDPAVNEERRYRRTVSTDGSIKYSYITKSKGTIERDTMPEIAISSEVYNSRFSEKHGEVIKKLRFTLYYDGINISDKKSEKSIEIKLDIYSGPLTGLVTAEVPVIDIEDAKSIYLPISLGVLENVTHNPLYKNGALSEVTELNQILFRKQNEATFTNLITGIINSDMNYGNKFRQDLKYFEEVGELAETILKDLQWLIEPKIKGTIAEELFDVVYYLLTKLIENNIDFDMSQLDNSQNYHTSFDSFKQLANYTARLNRNYDDKKQYQKYLLNYFLMLSGDIASKELDDRIQSNIEKDNYRTIINELITVVFEIARINNVDMESAAIVKELKNSIKYNRDSHFLVPKKEIEHKYVVDNLDSNLDLSAFSSEEFIQCYLSITPERRIRQEGNNYYYTEKGDGSLKRNEPIDRPITEGEYFTLLSEGFIGTKVCKTRYFLYFDPEKRIYYSEMRPGAICLQLDKYHGELDGKYTVETEFDSLADVVSFDSLPYMNGLQNVTENRLYKNKFIATNGWPKPSITKTFTPTES